jgi:hypothetical protein
LNRSYAFSTGTKNTNLAVLYNSTIGVIFLSTPHRGIDAARFNDVINTFSNSSLHPPFPPNPFGPVSYSLQIVTDMAPPPLGKADIISSDFNNDVIESVRVVSFSEEQLSPPTSLVIAKPPFKVRPPGPDPPGTPSQPIQSLSYY